MSAAEARAMIAPWLLVHHADEAAAYYKAAFSTVELHRLEGDGGKLELAQLAVQGAEFWIQEDAEFDPAAATTAGRGLARMILTVTDPDALFNQAVAAGAVVVVPMEEAHGWRVGRIADPFGHHWEIVKPI
ncbi:VOC family protein [Paenibacillus sp. OV219]|uniref:VOC family protein n=1 Tax=Paenibacillus sp. OV219 TaxID=1884377 RepID=UPI0008C7A250|nr:VOC family protein [Paenibacillus sp. OV219]SEO82289.1 PhnB protein [Paenibacillus sp. OV219]